MDHLLLWLNDYNKPQINTCGLLTIDCGIAKEWQGFAATGAKGLSLPLLGVTDAHAELARARLHAAADHEAVARLEDVQRARHCGIGHGAHKDGHILRQAGRDRDREVSFIAIVDR